MKNGVIKTEIDEYQENTTDVPDIQDFLSTDDQFVNDLDEIEVKCEKVLQGILLILYKIYVLHPFHNKIIFISFNFNLIANLKERHCFSLFERARKEYNSATTISLW